MMEALGKNTTVPPLKSGQELTPFKRSLGASLLIVSFGDKPHRMIPAGVWPIGL